MFSFDFKSGDVGEYVKQFKKLNSIQQTALLNSKIFSKEQKTFLARSAQINIPESDQVIATNKLANSQTVATATTSGLSDAFTGLWGSIKPVLTALANNPLTWAIGIGAATVALEDFLTVDYDEANAALDETISKYAEIKDALSSLNDELKTNKERITKLEKLDANGTITANEKDELENLKNKNKTLETNIKLQEKLLELQKQDKIDAAKEAFSKESHSVAQSIKMGDSTGKKNPKGSVERVTDAEAIDEDLALIKEYEEKVSSLDSKLSKEQQNVKKADNPIAKWFAKQKVKSIEGDKQHYEDSLKTLYKDLQTRSANVQEQLEILKLEPEANAEEIKTLETSLKSLDTQITNSGESLNDLTESEKVDSVTSSLEKLTTTSNSIGTLSTALKELSDNGYLNLDTISQIKGAIGDNISNWDEYEQKLLTVQKGSDEFNQIMGELTYATLEGKLGVEGLAEADEKYIASILRENGVLNANTTAHDMVTAAREKAKVQAYIQEQELDTLISALANEENALTTQANACGLSTNAYAALLAQEIAFSTNNMNVNDKLSKLSAIAVQAGLAAIEVDKLNTVMNGKGLKEDFAKENGIGVIKTSGRTTKNKNGKTVANWQYEYNGVVYESLDDAYFAKEYDELMNKLEMPTPIVTYSNTNSPNSTSTSQSFKETFNWIETALSRVQRTVTNFGKTVAATWQSWSTRNAALKDQMSAIRNEISLQDQAYNKYMSLANSVGLSEGYKALVRNGAIDISTIESESIAEAIKQYQEYYEKALAAKDASADLKDELAALSQTKFDNLAQSFADLMSGNEHAISMYEATIDLMEKRGYIASASLYDSLKEAETKNQNILKEKYHALSQALDEAVSSGTVVKYSEQWYQMQNEILAVEEAILESNNALAEFDNSLRELEWNAFDELQEQISEIHEETEFLDKMLSDEKKFNENGSITEYGQTALGLHAVNYKTYLAQAQEYAQELERIRQELAHDPYNQTLLDREDELLEKQRETIQSAEDEKQAMIDIASEGYDTLLDYMDQMIDKRKDMLSQAKDLYEYEKNISEQTKEITSLEKQLAAYQGDDSEEARATIQKLQVSLAEAKDNLEETEYDKYISDQEEMLDTLRLQTEEWFNARLDNEDQLLKDIVSSTEKNAAMIKDTLSQVVSSTGTTLSEAMKSIWSNEGDIGKAITEIKSYLANMQKSSDEKAKEQTAN